MANELDELNSDILEDGRDINVINKVIKVETNMIDKFIIFSVYGIGILFILFGILSIASNIVLCFILVSLGLGIGYYNYNKLRNIDVYFAKLQQRLQQSASTIDNYLENRVIQLENTAALVNKAVSMDREVFTSIAQARTGKKDMNTLQQEINNIDARLNLAFENYPELKSHSAIRDAMQQNMYTQREITAAREKYNDDIMRWNGEIFEVPYQRYVAAKKGYTTRIPFAVSTEVKNKARSVLF